METNLDPIDLSAKGVLGGLDTLNDALTQALALADELIKVDQQSGQTAKAMLKRLKSFGTSHYDFFSHGFRQQGSAHLEKSRFFSSEAVCAKIVFQIQEDLEIIVRAIQQRLNPAFRDKLREADELAYRILSQAQVNLGFPQAADPTRGVTQSGEYYGVLTYFQKSHEIRMIPYAPVALVAIPFSALTQPRDLLALPHEVGHYVFGHRPMNPETEHMDRDYLEDDPTYAEWQQEIYADVFGALFGGAIMAFDFQELAKQSYRGIFESRKDDHPNPYLRPLIYTEALRTRGNATEKRIADLLDERWAAYLLERWGWETRIEDQPNLEALKTEIAKHPKLITATPAQQEQHEDHLKEIEKAFKDLTFLDGRLTLGKKPMDIVSAALTLLSGRGDWSGPVKEFEDALKEGSNDLDAWFKIDANRATLRLAPAASLASRNDVSKLWDEWVVSEQLLDEATLEALGNKGGSAVQFGIGDDQPDFFKHPANPPLAPGKDFEPTWQGIWFAGRWATDPSGVPSGGQP